MKKTKSIVLLVAAFGLVIASCTKENTEADTCIVATVSSVSYFVDGQQYYANPQTEEEWSEFLDRMFALAEEGYAVRFIRNDNGQQVNASKEKVIYTTESYTDAKAWALQKTLEGYEVTISYDQSTGKYTCIAIR